MKKWNYRLVDDGECITIHEIHYFENGNIECYSDSPSYPVGDDIVELRRDIKNMMIAFNKPVLKNSELDNELKRKYKEQK